MSNRGTYAAIGEFEGRVQDLVDKGRTRPAAIHTVVISDPELHNRFLLAQNADRPKSLRHLRPEQGRSASPVNLANARAQWDAAIEKKVERGMSRPQAVRALARERPDLRQAMVTAENQATGRPVPGFGSR